MKYFISKKSYSNFYYEITSKNDVNQIGRYDNLKVGDSIPILNNGIDYIIKLREIKGNELYFEY